MTRRQMTLLPLERGDLERLTRAVRIALDGYENAAEFLEKDAQVRPGDRMQIVDGPPQTAAELRCEASHARRILAVLVSGGTPLEGGN